MRNVTTILNRQMDASRGKDEYRWKKTWEALRRCNVGKRCGEGAAGDVNPANVIYPRDEIKMGRPIRLYSRKASQTTIGR